MIVDVEVSLQSLVPPCVPIRTRTRFTRLQVPAIKSDQCPRWVKSQQEWQTCQWWVVARDLNWETKRTYTTLNLPRATSQVRTWRILPSTWSHLKLVWNRVPEPTSRTCSTARVPQEWTSTPETYSNHTPTSTRVSNVCFNFLSHSIQKHIQHLSCLFSNCYLCLYNWKWFPTRDKAVTSLISFWSSIWLCISYCPKVDVHSSQVGKKSVNNQGVYGSEGSSLRVGKERSGQDRESSLNERQRDNSNNGSGGANNAFHP